MKTKVPSVDFSTVVRVTPSDAVTVKEEGEKVVLEDSLLCASVSKTDGTFVLYDKRVVKRHNKRERPRISREYPDGLMHGISSPHINSRLSTPSCKARALLKNPTSGELWG